VLDERIDPDRLEMLLPAHRVREVHSYLIPVNVQAALARWNPTDVEPGDSLRPFLYWADDLVAGRKSPAEARLALIDEYLFQALLIAHLAFVQLARQIEENPEQRFPKTPQLIVQEVVERIADYLAEIEGT